MISSLLGPAASLLLIGFAAILVLGSGERAEADWLVTAVRKVAELRQDRHGQEIALTNGLITRTFRTSPNFATIGLTNLSTGASLLRGVKPEAVIELDGTRYEIGGLKGQPDYAYLDPDWVPHLTSSPDTFQFTAYHTGKPEPCYPWKPSRHSANA